MCVGGGRYDRSHVQFLALHVLSARLSPIVIDAQNKANYCKFWRLAAVGGGGGGWEAASWVS